MSIIINETRPALIRSSIDFEVWTEIVVARDAAGPGVTRIAVSFNTPAGGGFGALSFDAREGAELGDASYLTLVSGEHFGWHVQEGTHRFWVCTTGETTAEISEISVMVSDGPCGCG